MKVRLFSLLTMLALGSACSPREAPRTSVSESPAETAAAGAPSFVNKVWAVAESRQVALGDLRVFLAEGTMVMASSHGTPALGSWSHHDGQLTLTEEGIAYATDVLEITPTVFRIRIRGPGEPVLIRFEPADQPPVGVTAAPSPEGRTP